jgi:phytoene synthase
LVTKRLVFEMTVALFWVGSANPSTEVSNCLRFLDSVRVLDTMKFGNSRDRSLFFKLGEKKGRKQKWKSCSVNPDLGYLGGRSNGSKLPVISSMVASHAGEMAVLSSEEMVYNVVLKQAALVKKELKSRGDLDVKPDVVLPGTLSLLSEAYDRCGEVCAEYAKTFYLG